MWRYAMGEKTKVLPEHPLTNLTTNKTTYILSNKQLGRSDMQGLTTTNILDSIVPISRFNKGEANKIFSDVKKYGTRIVVKNNIPECVLMSPQTYQQIMNEYEDAVLLAEAQKRLSQNVEYTDHEDLMKKFGLTESDLNDVEVNLE